MRAAGAHEEAIRAFENSYRRLVSGEEALLPSAELEPATGVPALVDLTEADAAGALEHVAVIKLNGGLATTMGLQEPKSLVQAREGRSFLEIIVGQTLALRRRLGVRLPLVLMNSEVTRAATERALARYPEIEHEGIAPDFMQSMIPKLDAEQLAPVSWPANPALEWAPPGHGDVYGALRRSGMLDALLEQGFRHAIISNSDNLGRPRGSADRRAPRLRADPVPDGGGGGDRGRAQGRPHRTPAGRRQARAPRDGPDAPGGRGVVPRFSPLALLQHQQPLDRSAGARRHARTLPTACSRCR